MDDSETAERTVRYAVEAYALRRTVSTTDRSVPVVRLAFPARMERQLTRPLVASTVDGEQDAVRPRVLVERRHEVALGYGTRPVSEEPRVRSNERRPIPSIVRIYDTSREDHRW